METAAASDSELLAAWVGHRREPAFRELVARYAPLVHMAAKRTCDDDSLAADASQLVFILLAQKAKSLTSHPTLAGWLHVTAVMKTRDLVDKNRRESRKLQHLQAAMESRMHSEPGDAWQEMQPVLDDALAALSDKDREALLLRFYRSLSIREIAETLGIATDAAQKRIDRATERLRGKLAKRGVQAGGSLAGVMVAGFAADAQAAVPAVSILASKAIAAAASGSVTSIGILATILTIMKTSSVVLPAIALLAVGSGLAIQHQSIFAVERTTSDLQKQLVSSGTTSARPTAPKRETAAVDLIDWKQFVARIPELRQSRDRSEVTRIEQRLQAMTAEQLVVEQERITALDVPAAYRGMLQEMVMTPLTQKAPQLALARFVANPSSDTDTWWEPNEALKKWAMAAPGEASAWLDSQIAAGKLDSKSLDGKSELRTLLETTLIGVLIAADPAEADRRLGGVPENQRADVLKGMALAEKDQGAFGRLVRDQIPEKDRTKVIAEQASHGFSRDGYGPVTAYLENVGATPAERTATAEHVAVSSFQSLGRSGKRITGKDVDALREWIGTISPERADSLTGSALGNVNAGGGRGTTYAELAELAVKYGRAAGNDEVLVAFLRGADSLLLNKELSRTLAEKISDPGRRAEILKLQQQFRGKP